MNFNYVLSTGDSSITGSLLGFLERNRKSTNVDYQAIVFRGNPYSLDNNGDRKFEASTFDFNTVTGDHSSLLSLNSQTLLEGEEQINEGARFPYYTLASGEYFVDIERGSDVFHFCKELSVTDSDIVNYDKRDFATGILIYSTSSFDYLAIDALRSKVDSAYSNASTEVLLFDNYDVFLNGQKLKQSEYPSYTVTGNLFAIPKKDRIKEIYSGEADVLGTGFIENQLDFYLNGMEQSLDDILQLDTGVSQIIETGIELFIENRNLLTEETYNL
jgi:hypothetical protein